MQVLGLPCKLKATRSAIYGSGTHPSIHSKPFNYVLGQFAKDGYKNQHNVSTRESITLWNLGPRRWSPAEMSVCRYVNVLELDTNTSSNLFHPQLRMHMMLEESSQLQICRGFRRGGHVWGTQGTGLNKLGTVEDHFKRGYQQWFTDHSQEFSVI